MNAANASNKSSSSWGKSSPIDDFNSYAYLILLPIIFVIGLVGNSGTAVLLGRRWKRLPPNLVPFLFLCCADCGTLLIAVNNFMSQGVSKFWPDIIALWKMSDAACKGIYYFYLLFNTLSSGFICLAAIDRFIALTFPFKHKIIGKTFMLRACLVLFLVVAAISSIAPIFWGLQKKLRGSCFQDTSLPHTAQVVIQMYVSFIVNGTFFTVIVFILNMLIIFQLWRRSRNGIQANIVRHDSRATTVLLCMTGMYTVLVFPKSILFTISTCIYYFAKKPYSDIGAFYYLQIAHTLNLLYYFNCAMNWVILVIRMRDSSSNKKTKKTVKSPSSTRSTNLSSKSSTSPQQVVVQTRM